jgi:hypothetical protein
MRDIHRLIHMSSRCAAALLVICGQPATSAEADCAADDEKAVTMRLLYRARDVPTPILRRP